MRKPGWDLRYDLYGPWQHRIGGHDQGFRARCATQAEKLAKITKKVRILGCFWNMFASFIKSSLGAMGIRHKGLYRYKEIAYTGSSKPCGAIAWESA